MKFKQKLSPFELKSQLINASKEYEGEILDAGRGNPNFLTTDPRDGFFEWGRFASKEAKRQFNFLNCGLGGLSVKCGIKERMENYLDQNEGIGVEFIKKTISFVRDYLGYNETDFIYEVTNAIIGGEYPNPDRMLVLCEKIVKQYLIREMSQKESFSEPFELFATEGGAAGMAYLFNTLERNHILNKGDYIAVGTPIFTPYLEIPKLSEYEYCQINVEATSEGNWQYSNESLDQLLNPELKIFFLVNPSNPTSVKMSNSNLKRLQKIIEQRPDLIVVTDDVYATFADNFKSVFTVAPKNTILVYSFSKYFGATGWRLGVIATSCDCVVDGLLKKLPKNLRDDLNYRYSSVSENPGSLKFIDRIVAESRIVALKHVAGVSTPSQVQMMLFCIFALMDRTNNYKKSVKELIRAREHALYKKMNIDFKEDDLTVGYYSIIELDVVGSALYGENFGKWAEREIDQNEFLFKLARQEGVILLPALGFGTSASGFRISFANLNEYDYLRIGDAISSVLSEYYNNIFLNYWANAK